MRRSAARLSAEMPSWNALTRSGRGSGRGVRGAPGLARRTMFFFLAGFLPRLFGERERALVNVPARQAGRLRHFADGVFERHARERLAQHGFGVAETRPFRRLRRRDDDNDFTARF